MGIKMRSAKKRVIVTGLLAMLAIVPVEYPYCNSTATPPPPSEEKCNWPCKDLKTDWNYLFHPERINQCKPRDIKSSI